MSPLPRHSLLINIIMEDDGVPIKNKQAAVCNEEYLQLDRLPILSNLYAKQINLTRNLFEQILPCDIRNSIHLESVPSFLTV